MDDPRGKRMSCLTATLSRPRPPDRVGCQPLHGAVFPGGIVTSAGVEPTFGRSTRSRASLGGGLYLNRASVGKNNPHLRPSILTG